jgi:hypothetical protein
MGMSRTDSKNMSKIYINLPIFVDVGMPWTLDVGRSLMWDVRSERTV